MSSDSSKGCDYDQFLRLHSLQLKNRCVPDHFWRTVYEKCSDSIIDAGDVFSFEDMENDVLENVELHSFRQKVKWKVCVISEGGISSQDGSQLYLIDHAYSYDLRAVRYDLLTNEGLRERLASIMNVITTARSTGDIVDNMLQEIWRYAGAYNYAQNEAEDGICTCWYIMDELGSRIQHSSNPTFRAVPFYYMESGVAYTLLFPIRDVLYGEEVTRNYVENEYDSELGYHLALLPWEHKLFTDIDFCPGEPDVGFLQSSRVQEILPDDIPEVTYVSPCTSKLKIYCNYSVISEHLKHLEFELTSEEKEADVLWLTYHFKDFKRLSENTSVLINQFPYEHILTSKDLLAVVARRTTSSGLIDENTLKTYPLWLPTTYNLRTEVCEFVSYFQQREIRGLDNHWICKPWNQARGEGIHITNNLACILRLRTTGPKVACKYIIDPVLFPRQGIGMVKMDIRYIVLLKCVNPLKLYVYKHFWLRFANKPFLLDDFHDYEKHFTVMNYNECYLKQMFCEDFISCFEDCYKEHVWSDIEAEIFKMFKDLFIAATHPPPSGLYPNPQSRAMYGIDLMLEWDRENSDKPRIQPVILEVNWAPDCQRACDYYPDFFNDVFEVLFLPDRDNNNVVML